MIVECFIRLTTGRMPVVKILQIQLGNFLPTSHDAPVVVASLIFNATKRAFGCIRRRRRKRISSLIFLVPKS